MPPRYAYWTIIVDGQPTAFRSGTQEELMPTFKRLKAKNDSAVMMWWQSGKLWPSRIDAQEMMRARAEMGRRGDERQAGSAFRERERKPPRERTAWTPRGEPSTPAPRRNADDKLDWKPKGEFVPAPKRADRTEWTSKESLDTRKPAWKPKGSFDREQKGESSPKGPRPEKPEWKPKGSFDRDRKPNWNSKPASPSTYAKASADRQARKPSGSEKPEWKPKGSFDRKPEWKPKVESSETAGGTAKRKWVPKAEYKKSLGIEAKRDHKWRPGGEHRDPRQKYKDAKKAKWTKFKKNIRQKWEQKAGKKSDK